jgi:hypothetical protein
MSAHDELSQVLTTYFHGIYVGDVAALKSIFHPRAELFGEVKGQTYQKTLFEYLTGVASRKSPSELGERFSMKTIFLDVVGPIAVAKVNCPMLGFNYIDYLTVVRLDGKWLIVSKTLTHVECDLGSQPLLRQRP